MTMNRPDDEGEDGTPEGAEYSLPERTDADAAFFDEPICRPLVGYTNSEICDELRLRFRCFVFMGTEPKHDDNDGFFLSTHGNTITCVGLATLLQQSMVRSQMTP